VVKIIINPFSGKGSRIWEEIKKKIEALGIEYDFVITTKEKEATYLAKKIQEQGFKNIFIVGGDGSINEVINGLNFKDISLGVIPAGCGNDFAKMIGIKNINDGISSILSGYKKLVDVGFANDNYFINNLGIGLDAYVVYIQKRFKNIKGKFTPLERKLYRSSSFLTRFSYLTPTLKALFNFLPFSAEIESGDFKFSGQVLSISIGNGRCHGGIFMLTPYAQIDDGLLDICVIKKTNRLKRFFNLYKAIKGTHLSLKEVEIFRARDFSISSQEPFFIHFDGEFFAHPINKLEVKVLNKQLQFSVPKIE